MPAQPAIRSLLLPISGGPVLLPSLVLAEVITYRMPNPIPYSPSWLLGGIEWRGGTVPVVACEGFWENVALGTPIGTRIAILNGITGLPSVSVLGLRIQGIPRLALIREEDLSNRESDFVLSNATDLLYLPVTVSGQPMLLLNLEKLENNVSSQLDIAFKDYRFKSGNFKSMTLQ